MVKMWSAAVCAFVCRRICQPALAFEKESAHNFTNSSAGVSKNKTK